MATILSTEAKDAIKVMLDPESKVRPTAREVLELPFFKKHSKSMTRNNSDSNLAMNFQSNKNSDIENATLRAKLRECEVKIESLTISNKNLNELVESKESKFRSLMSELDEYKQRYFKAKDDLENELRNSRQSTTDKQVVKTNSLSSGNRTVDELRGELSRYKSELDKSQETTKTIYDKTKGISVKVSDFYLRNILTQDLGQTHEFVLSFDSTLTKLDAIFDEFLRLKRQMNGGKVSIFSENHKEPSSYRMFAKSRSPGKSIINEDEHAKIQDLQKNIHYNDKNIKTYLSPMSEKKY